MQKFSVRRFHRFLPALLLSAAASFGVCSTLSPAFAAQAAAGLKPYTTPDQSASAGVPQDWQVTKGEDGVIMMSGPQGEQIGLGEGIFVHNGPPGAAFAPPVQASMPASATLGQKYMMLWKQASAISGEPDPQIKVLSARRIPIASGIAECGLVLGSMVKNNGPQKFESQFCSLRPDSGSIFKLVWNHASIPDAVAQKERATVEAVMHSYRPSRATIKLWIQPLTPQMPVGMPVGGGGMMPSSGVAPDYWGMIGADHAAECMDLGVIREEPIWRQPSYCH